MPTNTRHKSCLKKYSWPIPSSTKVCGFSYKQDPTPFFFLKSISKVSAPQEATLDSAFLVTASNMHAAKARAMKAGAGAFDVDDFVSKLITFMGGRRGGGGGGGGAGPKDRDRPPEADYDEGVDDYWEDDDDGDGPL